MKIGVTRHTNIERLINMWFRDNFLDYSGYRYIRISFEVYGRNIYIYTNSPGIFIGRCGETINKLREILKENKIRKKINIIKLGNYPIAEEILVKRKWF